MKIEPKLDNPICIKLNNEKCYIISGENFENEYCLSQGLVFSKEHHGFVLIVDYNGKQKEYIYPSQCKIIATGIDNSNLKIFEEGKYNPWIFTRKGLFKQKTSYNQYSRKDMEFIENCCELNSEEIKNNFSLILKKIDK